MRQILPIPAIKNIQDALRQLWHLLPVDWAFSLHPRRIMWPLNSKIGSSEHEKKRTSDCSAPSRRYVRAALAFACPP